jgi:hypothetical protein
MMVMVKEAMVGGRIDAARPSGCAGRQPALQFWFPKTRLLYSRLTRLRVWIARSAVKAGWSHSQVGKHAIIQRNSLMEISLESKSGVSLVKAGQGWSNLIKPSFSAATDREISTEVVEI